MKKHFYKKLGIILILAAILACVIPFSQPNPFFTKEPVLPEDSPIEELQKLTYAKTLNNNVATGVIAYSDKPKKITYKFIEKISSVRGYWYSDNSSLRILSPFSEIYEGSVKYNKNFWGDKIYSPSNKKIKDLKFTATVTLPKSLLHQYVSLEAKLTVYYPHYSEYGGFSNMVDPLSKAFQLYVATPEEVKYVQWYNIKHNIYLWLDNFIFFYLAGFVLIVCGVCAFVTKEKINNL